MQLQFRATKRRMQGSLRFSPDYPRGDVRRAGPVGSAGFYRMVLAAVPALLERGDSG
jgi:hypothetical protein